MAVRSLLGASNAGKSNSNSRIRAAKWHGMDRYMYRGFARLWPASARCSQKLGKKHRRADIEVLGQRFVVLL